MKNLTGNRNGVVCPQPRRVGLLNTTVNHPVPWWHVSHQQELRDAEAANELLEILLSKRVNGVERQNGEQVALSPPFFSGSPPSRVSNPIIQDARFGDERFPPISPTSIPIPPGSGPPLSPSSSGRKGGCVRANFGNNPAVRVEGFDCLDRDRRNGGIPTLA